jgi:PKHD-type hydroxylase
MSNYIFAPAPTFGVSEHPFVTWNDAFSDEELNKLIEYCNTLKFEKATVGMGEESTTITRIRESKVAWIDNTLDSGWIYDRMAYVARSLNGQFYKFDLYGFSEHMQFTVYEEDSGGHYTWHIDSGGSGHSTPPRKLSCVLQLSDPSEYEGGDLEVFTSGEPTKIDKKKGLIAAFPSYTLHRVTPVTKGTRRSLVVWVTGPAFK